MTRSKMQKPTLDSYFKTALNLHNAGKLKEARGLYHEILKREPNHWESLAMIGKSLYQEDRFQDAAKYLEKALHLNLMDQKISLLYVKTLAKSGAYEKALEFSKEKLDKEAHNSQMRFQYAKILKEMGEVPQAVREYEKLLELAPDHRQALNNLGNLYQGMGYNDQALACYDRLIKVDGHFAMAYCNKAGLLHKIGSIESARDHYLKAISCDDSLSLFYYNLGQLYTSEYKDYEKAKDVFAAGLERGDKTYRKGLKFKEILAKQHLVDWSSRKVDDAFIDELVSEYINSDLPFDIVPYELSYSNVDLTSFKKLAMKYANRMNRKVRDQFPDLNYSFAKSGEKIKIGYLSPDFNVHPGGLLVWKLFDHHDSKEFEVHAFSLVESEDFVNQEIRNTVDFYYNVSRNSTREIADLINRSGIDILVALEGYSQSMKMDVLAFRPAPIQMILLGSHSTTGAPFIDYAFTDEFMYDKDLREQYSESVIRLPCSLLLNSEIPNDFEFRTTRKDFGLPEEAFVFASFNHPKKIDPKTFSAWMQILEEVKNSVLWVYDGGLKSIHIRIREYASNHQISSDRIHFAGKLEIHKHWERFKHVDLFLDCFPFNAHVTAVETLRLRKPILTKYGDRHNNRLCSSLLHHAGLNELITYSTSEYIDKAIHFAKNGRLLSAITERLRKPELLIFDSEIQIKYLEKAYKKAMLNFSEKRSAADFIVSSILKFDTFN